MFGPQVRLPIDLAFGLPLKVDRSPSYREYVQKLISHLEGDRWAATINAAKALKKKKVCHTCRSGYWGEGPGQERATTGKAQAGRQMGIIIVYCCE